MISYVYSHILHTHIHKTNGALVDGASVDVSRVCRVSENLVYATEWYHLYILTPYTHTYTRRMKRLLTGGPCLHTCVWIRACLWVIAVSGAQVCCSVLQCVAVCCNVRQYGTCLNTCVEILSCSWAIAVCCSVLQCVAVCCSVLQCVAVYINVCICMYVRARGQSQRLLRSTQIVTRVL